MKKRKISIWERWLSAEIGIEFKACLYFFCILFFYAVYRLVCGSREAGILHMAEMIFLTYIMGYVQLILLHNFDEGERLGGREIAYIFMCSFIYAGVSFLGGWFDGKAVVSAGFLLYMICAYICAYLVYKFKREIDARMLNEDLKAFQERRGEHGKGD